jgi:hypothetical protein
LPPRRRGRFRSSPTSALPLPIVEDLHADAGIGYSAFGSNLRDYDYGELYAGMSSRRWSARVHVSPDYFGFAGGSLYGDFDATQPLGDRVALLGHVGVLFPTGRGVVASTGHLLDARAGVALDFAGFDLQIVWVSTNATRAGYPIDSRQRSDTVVMSVSRSF